MLDGVMLTIILLPIVLMATVPVYIYYIYLYFIGKTWRVPKTIALISLIFFPAATTALIVAGIALIALSAAGIDMNWLPGSTAINPLADIYLDAILFFGNGVSAAVSFVAVIMALFIYKTWNQISGIFTAATIISLSAFAFVSTWHHMATAG